MFAVIAAISRTSLRRESFVIVVFPLGVADGVGGWRKYGIDPSEFSRKLMRECEKRVSSGDFDPKNPETLLEKAFKATAEAPRPVGEFQATIFCIDEQWRLGTHVNG